MGLHLVVDFGSFKLYFRLAGSKICRRVAIQSCPAYGSFESMPRYGISCVGTAVVPSRVNSN